jgi:hypothetical protein
MYPKFPTCMLPPLTIAMTGQWSTKLLSIWNKEELSDQWKESYNYRGISLLSTSYKMLSNILLSRLSPYIDEIIGDQQCGFQRNR